MPDSRNLRVLEAAEDMTATVFDVVVRVQVHRAPGVRGQLVRSAASVSANIAEASDLGSDKNFKRQLRLALASANEVGSHLRIIKRTGALDPMSVARCETKRVVVCRMLVNLINRIEMDEAYEEDKKRSGRKKGD